MLVRRRADAKRLVPEPRRHGRLASSADDRHMKPRVVLLLTQCHDEKQMAMQQRCKRERVRQHIREISKWYAGSRRYRHGTEALLQVRDP